MKIIDSHQHFWQFDPQRDAWIDDTMRILQRDFMPQDIAPIFAQNKVVGSIAVQADTSEAETSFLLDLAQKNPLILGVVGWADFTQSQVEETLEKFSDQPSLKGYRHIVQKEPNGFLDRKDFRAGIQKLAAYDYSYDLLVFPHQLEETIRFVKAFPNHRFVLDHLAKPYIKKKEISPWKEHLQELAAFPNVSCKVSGMVTEADWQNWKFNDFIPYLDIVTDAFGTDRLLFGSDWPVCLLGGRFEKILQLALSYYASFSTQEQEAIFYGNAQRFYKVNEK